MSCGISRRLSESRNAYGAVSGENEVLSIVDNITERKRAARALQESEDDARLLLRELRRGGYDVTFERVETARAMNALLDRHSWDAETAYQLYSSCRQW